MERGGGSVKGEAEPKRQTVSAVAPLTNTDKLSFPPSSKTTGDEVQLQSRCVGNASLFRTLKLKMGSFAVFKFVRDCL